MRKNVKGSRSVPQKSTSFQERGKVLYFLDITAFFGLAPSGTILSGLSGLGVTIPLGTIN